ncbi:MAG: hypothetical protein ACXVNQ_10645, partial [Bacteroidia bacterium]
IAANHYEKNFSWGLNSSSWHSYASDGYWEMPTKFLFKEDLNGQENIFKRAEEMEKHEVFESSGLRMFGSQKNVPSPKLYRIKTLANELNKIVKEKFPNSFNPMAVSDLYVNYSISKGKPFKAYKDKQTGTIQMEGDSLVATWEMHHFYHVSMATVMRTLTLLQLQVCIMEQSTFIY